MGRENSKKRTMIINKNNKRKVKLLKLRQQYLASQDEDKKEKILAKVAKVAPWLTKEEFLLK